MEDFIFWAETGFSHIVDLAGYDHTLFLISMCCVFTFEQWRWLFLVSAFTLGHATSLALSVMHVISLPSDWIEVMIPASIAISCIMHLRSVYQDKFTKASHWQHLVVVMSFGLIHGLGFSNFLRSMLGAEVSIVKPLLFFHVGLEGGQILIILFILLITTTSERYLKVGVLQRIRWVCWPVLLLSLWMTFDRLSLF